MEFCIECLASCAEVTLMWSRPMSFCPSRAVYWLGNDTLRVSAALFAENRRRLCTGLAATDGLLPHSVVVLQGGEQKQRYCTDTDMVFRQVGLVWDQRRTVVKLLLVLIS